MCRGGRDFSSRGTLMNVGVPKSCGANDGGTHIVQRWPLLRYLAIDRDIRAVRRLSLRGVLLLLPSTLSRSPTLGTSVLKSTIDDEG